MQNTIRWRSDQFQPKNIWNPWSNETDTNLEDSACVVILPNGYLGLDSDCKEQGVRPSSCDKKFKTD